jgi:hypothetical protein
MKKIFYGLLLVFLAACNNSDKKTDASSDDIGAASAFLRAALDGDFARAKTYIINDSVNQVYIDLSERQYRERMMPNEKARYKDASIIVHEFRHVNDSTTIIYYSNTYRNQRDSLKVLKQDGKWLVDFKYIFKYKPDSLQ